jgi:hypothetical protein
MLKEAKEAVEEDQMIEVLNNSKTYKSKWEESKNQVKALN